MFNFSRLFAFEENQSLTHHSRKGDTLVLGLDLGRGGRDACGVVRQRGIVVVGHDEQSG